MGDAQLLGGDKYELYAAVPGHCSNQRVDSTAELQVTAQTYGQVFKTALFAPDGQKVRQSLGGVVVTAVAGIDHGDTCLADGHHRSAFLGMAHGNDVSVAANGAHSISHALALSGGGGGCGTEAQHIAAQFHHSRFKAEAGTGGGFKEQGGQLLAVASVGIFFGVCDDIFRGLKKTVHLLHSQVGDVQQALHHLAPFTAR